MLASRTFSRDDFPRLAGPYDLHVDFSSSNVLLVAGAQLAVVIRSDEVEDVYRFFGTLDDGYAGGAAYARATAGPSAGIWMSGHDK